MMWVVLFYPEIRRIKRFFLMWYMIYTASKSNVVGRTIGSMWLAYVTILWMREWAVYRVYKGGRRCKVR